MSRCLLRFALVTMTIANALALSLLSAARVSAQDAADNRQQCLDAYAQAQELRLEGGLLAARAQLLTCSQSTCPGPILRDCAGWLSEVENSLPSVVFAVSDDQGRDVMELRVLANDRELAEHAAGRAVTLDPGRYTFVFLVPGYERAEHAVTLREAEKSRLLHVQLHKLQQPAPVFVTRTSAPAPPPPVYSWPVATTVLGGAALVGASTFLYFGLHGKGLRDDAERCPMNCRALIDDGKRDYLVANIGLGAAVATAVSAGLIYWLVESKPDRPARASTPARTAF